MRRILIEVGVSLVLEAIAVFFLANHADGRTEVVLEIISPIAASILPYIAIVCALGAGIVLLVNGWRLAAAGYNWMADRRQGGPDKRRFQAMQAKIGECKSLLLSLDDPNFRKQIETPYEYQTRETRLRIELGYLSDKLSSMGIRLPNQDLTSPPQRSNLLIYLTELEVRAQYGDIQSARNLGN